MHINLLAPDALLRRALTTHDTIVRMVALLGTLLILGIDTGGAVEDLNYTCNTCAPCTHARLLTHPRVKRQRKMENDFAALSALGAPGDGHVMQHGCIGEVHLCVCAAEHVEHVGDIRAMSSRLHSMAALRRRSSCACVQRSMWSMHSWVGGVHKAGMHESDIKAKSCSKVE